MIHSNSYHIKIAVICSTNLVCLKFLLKLINQYKTVNVTTVIKMQFIVFCSLNNVKLCFSKKIIRTSSVISGTISKQISIRIRLKTTNNVMVSACLSFYTPWSVPMDDSSCVCFFPSREFVLCYNKSSEPHSYTFILTSVL